MLIDYQKVADDIFSQMLRRGRRTYCQKRHYNPVVINSIGYDKLTEGPYSLMKIRLFGKTTTHFKVEKINEIDRHKYSMKITLDDGKMITLAMHN